LILDIHESLPVLPHSLRVYLAGKVAEDISFLLKFCKVCTKSVVEMQQGVEIVTNVLPKSPSIRWWDCRSPRPKAG